MLHINNVGQKETIPVIQPTQRSQSAVKDVVEEREICIGP